MLKLSMLETVVLLNIFIFLCYFLFSTVLSKIFYIKDTYMTYSPQDKKIAEIIKIIPFKSLGTLGS